MSAVTCLVIVSGSGGGGVVSRHRCRWDAFVVVVNYLFRIVHATVTDLDGVSVKDFSKLLIFGKVLPMNVVPEDVTALSVSPFACFGWFIPQ